MASKLDYTVGDREHGQLVQISKALNPVPVSTSGTGDAFTVVFARPANTTAYAAGDVVGEASAALLKFADITSEPGCEIMIIGAELRIDVAAVPSGMTYFRLALYSAPPPSAFADNAAFSIADTDRPCFLGFVTIGSPADEGATLYCESSQTKPVKLPGTSLYAYLITGGAYTPTSAAVKQITLHRVVL